MKRTKQKRLARDVKSLRIEEVHPLLHALMGEVRALRAEVAELKARPQTIFVNPAPVYSPVRIPSVWEWPQPEPYRITFTSTDTKA